MQRSGPHGFDLAMPRAQFLDCATAKQLAIFPRGPERDTRLAQCLDIQGMHALCRRVQRHATKMFLQQFEYLGAAQVIYFNVDERLPLPGPPESPRYFGFDQIGELREGLLPAEVAHLDWNDRRPGTRRRRVRLGQPTRYLGEPGQLR